MNGEITEITLREIQLPQTEKFVLVKFGSRGERVHLSISRVRGWQERRGFLTLTLKEFVLCCNLILPGRVMSPEAVMALACEYRPKGQEADIGIPSWCDGVESVIPLNEDDPQMMQRELDVSNTWFVFVDQANAKDSL